MRTAFRAKRSAKRATLLPPAAGTSRTTAAKTLIAVQTSTGDQYAYFKNINSTSFYTETEITVTKDLGDAYPKFGLAARVGGNTFFFYIDGSGNYTAQRVGYVSRNNNGDWGWGTSLNAEKAVNLGSYKDGKYVKLGMLRDGKLSNCTSTTSLSLR